MTTQAATTTALARIPSRMRAWQVASLGEPAQAMDVRDVAVPRPEAGEVLVQVSYAGLSFADALLARGHYQERPSLPFTPGLELCGEIAAVGAGVEHSRLGERVIGLCRLPHGSLAKFALARASDVVPAPPGLDDVKASVFHVAYQAGWFGLYRRAALRVGEWLLVHAAAGGLGSAAVQLGRAAGAHVIGVVGSPEKVAVARRLGAGVVVDRSTQDVAAVVQEATNGRGVDVVYDPVGGDAFALSTKVIAFEGRIVVVGFTGGTVAKAATNHLLVKNYSLLGLHWALYARNKPELITRVNHELTSLVAAGALNPLVSETLAFADASTGIERVAAGSTVGRLTVSPP